MTHFDAAIATRRIERAHSAIAQAAAIYIGRDLHSVGASTFAAAALSASAAAYLHRAATATGD